MVAELTPDVTVIIPTLNAERVLRRCLESIVEQKTSLRLEILVIDAGSTDGSRDIALRHGAIVLDNPAQTGEAGKSIGLRFARGDLVAFIDSDNVLVGEHWFDQMTAPFAETDVVASEPLRYVARRHDCFLTRYFAHLGMGDPLCLFLGNYDRFSALTGRWTDMPVRAEGRSGYEKVWLNAGQTPTIGANGFVVRRQVLIDLEFGDYLADVDVVDRILEQQLWAFAKVDCGIVHLLADNVHTFCRKQRRRIQDFLHYHRQGMRTGSPVTRHRWGLAKFITATAIGWPLVWQAACGCYRTGDVAAWLFHPAACTLTLFEYGRGVIVSRRKSEPLQRDRWSQ